MVVLTDLAGAGTPWGIHQGRGVLIRGIHQEGIHHGVLISRGNHQEGIHQGYSSSEYVFIITRSPNIHQGSIHHYTPNYPGIHQGGIHQGVLNCRSNFDGPGGVTPSLVNCEVSCHRREPGPAEALPVGEAR